MVNFFKTVFMFGFLCLWSGCVSPTDVDAVRKNEQVNPEPKTTKDIKFASKHLDFGYIVLSKSGLTEIPVYNLSATDTVSIDSLVMASGGGFFKAVVQGISYPVKLLPGERTSEARKIYIEFLPVSAGEFTDSLFINGDRKNFIELHGISGVAPAGDSITVRDVDFGEVSLGTPKDLPVEIKNTGSTTITVSFEDLPKDKTGFSFKIMPGEYTIAPGTTKNIIVTFAPMAMKAYSQQMQLYIRGAKGYLNGSFIAKGKGIQ